MNTLKKSAAVVCAAVCSAFPLACGSSPDSIAPKSAELAAPKEVTRLEHSVDSDAFRAYKDGVEDFSAKFTAATYSGGTYAVSPVSVYLALALTSACADGNTEKQILSALNTDKAELEENYPLFYRSIYKELSAKELYNDRVAQDAIIASTLPSNSIWIGSNVGYKSDCIQDLSDNYYCYSYSADFSGDNAAANAAVRKFVSDKTHGLIDKSFDISPETLFTIINTLYLKDVWTAFGDEISVTDESYTFDGKTKNAKTPLLIGDYLPLRAYHADGYSACYTRTAYGNKLIFIVPTDGRSVDDVFTYANIGDVLSHDFKAQAVDDASKTRYETCCLFPEFSASYDDDIDGILKSNFGITDLFDSSCSLKRLTDDNVVCSKVRHVAELEVNRKGIEGAAVTEIAFAGAGAGEEDKYTTVYETFTVDKQFGFVILDGQDTVLFSGAVTDL